MPLLGSDLSLYGNRTSVPFSSLLSFTHSDSNFECISLDKIDGHLCLHIIVQVHFEGNFHAKIY